MSPAIVLALDGRALGLVLAAADAFADPTLDAFDVWLRIRAVVDAMAPEDDAHVARLAAAGADALGTALRLTPDDAARAARS